MNQWMIIILGGLSIGLISTKRWIKWGFVCGLLSEPFWLWTSWHNDQWAIVILCFVYAGFYINGIRNHWKGVKCG